jgi:hypothetical protein
MHAMAIAPWMESLAPQAYSMTGDLPGVRPS